MDANLRQHLDRAVTDDPGADPGEMAYTSIAQGGVVRRRRVRLATAAGVVAVLAVVAGVTLRPAASGSADPSVPVAPAMVLVAAPSCSVDPVRSGATDVVIMAIAPAHWSDCTRAFSPTSSSR